MFQSIIAMNAKDTVLHEMLTTQFTKGNAIDSWLAGLKLMIIFYPSTTNRTKEYSYYSPHKFTRLIIPTGGNVLTWMITFSHAIPPLLSS